MAVSASNTYALDQAGLAPFLASPRRLLRKSKRGYSGRGVGGDGRVRQARDGQQVTRECHLIFADHIHLYLVILRFALTLYCYHTERAVRISLYVYRL
jgi:hypothetical protein